MIMDDKDKAIASLKDQLKKQMEVNRALNDEVALLYKDVIELLTSVKRRINYTEQEIKASGD